MHNHDHKYPSRPGFEPGTPRLQAPPPPPPVDTNKSSGPAIAICYRGTSTKLQTAVTAYLKSKQSKQLGHYVFFICFR